jgi:hypothetical protein
MATKNKCEVKRSNEKGITLQFNGLTDGEVFAIRNALTADHSPTGRDVLAYFKNGFDRAGLDIYLD